MNEWSEAYPDVASFTICKGVPVGNGILGVYGFNPPPRINACLLYKYKTGFIGGKFKIIFPGSNVL